VGDHGEVCEVALNGCVQDGLGPGVAEGGPVLVQQVHQLLADVSENKYILLPSQSHLLNYFIILTKFLQVYEFAFYILEKLTW
jgi:hypothetical protein